MSAPPVNEQFRVSIALGLRHLAVALRAGMGLHGPSIETAIQTFTMAAVIVGGLDVARLALSTEEFDRFCSLVNVDELLEKCGRG